ncbi:hypothetical protein BCR34DRAFT_228447 [Clohesyomyces aquaticus]|uniref:DUF676 domain-containing protein n=1 Tax=Clohesyomyces aquaticus TaxID=1231657 RepID=A0A1Y1ZWD3_9PLEO|nr:hypothetical protein BCR34DRAFT_228447 [Clohesyomyces aquaticus]
MGFSKLKEKILGNKTPRPNALGPPSPAEGSGSTTLLPSSPTPFSDGLETLHDCADAVFYIYFVHGLTGDRGETWTARGQAEPWPKILLPPVLGKARILTYGYDAYVMRKSVASTERLIDHATNLINDLATDRASSDAVLRPIVFVVHSLGCIVCKKALLLSRNNPAPHLKNIFHCTKDMIFMGTPHAGSWMAHWASIPASGLGIVKSTNKSLLKSCRQMTSFWKAFKSNSCPWSEISEIVADSSTLPAFLKGCRYLSLEWLSQQPPLHFPAITA